MLRFLAFLALSVMVAGAVAPAVAQKRPRMRAISVEGGATAKEQRFALVIGNSRYEFSPLKNPANDAQAMAKTLRGLGFQVIEKRDASRRDMRRAIIDFGNRLRNGGVGLFYYAGHGIQIKGSNYLIPVDAEIDVEDHVLVEGVSLNQVLARMGGARNRMNIVILDACRNNPYARSFRSSSNGLAQTLAPAGTYIAYATAPGEVAEDGEGRNSRYTVALTRWMKEPGLKLEEVFKQVRKRVQRASEGQQVPWTSSSVTGEFYFRSKRPGALAAAGRPGKGREAGPSSNRVLLDLEFWQSVKESANPADFREYLNRFPKGTFSGLARNRLAELGASADVPKPDDTTLAKKLQLAAQAGISTAAGNREVRLTSAEVRTRLGGRTIRRLRTRDLANIRTTFRRNGELAGELRRGRRVESDSGAWTLSDDGMLCLRWRTWEQGSKRCFHVAAKGLRNIRLYPLGETQGASYVVEAPRAR